MACGFRNGSTIRLTGDRTYDKLNRLTAMANVPQSGLPVNFSYQYNDANQRIRTALADGSYWVYEYDARGQVIRGRRFWADNTPVAGQQFDYTFDDIGNRTTTQAGGDSTGGNQRSAGYTRDYLNRYSSRTVPGGFDVLGLATATSAVTVNSQTAYRKGEYFWYQVGVSNGSVPVWQNNTISVSGVTPVSGNVWVPQTPEAYTYDDDGNLLTDGRWTYTWDAENRLVRMVARTAVGPQQRLDFEYDHQGRRIRKKVWNNTGGTGSPATDLKFIYDGWNLIAEVSNADALVRQYLWGLDLSGTLQGAGGVGGLVKIYDQASAKTYFPGYDGNGNVVVLVDGSTGSAGANYEYGPFGELIRASGTYAAMCPYRFSTKYRDGESDLLYYGYRYYNPSSGRWLSRDTIEEKGGKNLLAFVANSTSMSFDVLGEYDASGHFYTTYIVAVAALGLDEKEMAYELAFYSQLPDAIPTYEAIHSWYPWNSPWLNAGLWSVDIQRELHSLVGGKATKRRACLKRMIMGKCSSPLKTWERGFVIHAFGDSYAHTKPNGDLYSAPVGHGLQGSKPDWIPRRPRLYTDYMYDLFDALGGTDRSKLGVVEDLVNTLGFYDAPGVVAARFRDLATQDPFLYSKGYFPEENPWLSAASANGQFNDVNGSWLPTPSTDDVKKLMKKIQACCGCSNDR